MSKIYRCDWCKSDFFYPDATRGVTVPYVDSRGAFSDEPAQTFDLCSSCVRRLRSEMDKKAP